MHSHSSMNRVYRIVWNEALSMWVAVAENAKGRSKGGIGRKRLAALLAATLGSAAGVMPPAMAGPLDGIVIDGRTNTQLSQPSVNAVNITTTTVNGGNAFNSFSRFSVDAGNIANLHVPTGATNLINIVRDARTDINGVLNGIKDGRIGGNVWFANPYGLVVGAGGVVNVGSLNVSTPTAAFVQGFFGANGPNANYVQQLLNGTAPLNADGTVSILGRVNAINGVVLSAGAINVRGAIYSGARFLGTAPDFSDVVNANGLSVATGIVEQEGRIRIIASQTQGGKAAINLDGAQMLATSIELSATSTLTDASLAVTSGLAKAEAAASIDIQGSQLRTLENLTAQATTTVATSTFTTPIAASVQRVDARATVNVGGSSQLTVGGDALLGATTSVSTNATPTSALANKAGDAAVAVSDVTSLAQVRVTDTSTAAVTGKLGLAAVNTVSTTSVADAAAAGNNAAGAAVAVSVIDSTTSAVIDGQAAITAGALDLSAASRNTATVTAKAASQGAEKDDSGSSQGSQTLAKYKDNASTADSAPGEGIKVAGAVAVSDLSSHTQALLASGQAAKVAGAVGLRSEEGNTVVVAADSSATNSATGVAAAVAINLAQLSNEAAIAQTLQAGSVSASASMAAAAPVNSFTTTAVSGAGASNVGVAGALAVNAIDSATAAALRGGANVTLAGAGGDVALTARNASASTAKATPAASGASGDKVGIGASVAVNVVGTRTLAQLADGAQLQGARDVALDAGGTHAVTTEAEAGSEGGISITPSVAVSIANNTTQASLGASSKLPLTLGGDLLLNAAQSATTRTTAKGSAVGGKAAIGAAVAVALVDDLVEATTARAIVANGASGAGKGQVTFKAQGASASEVSATASASGGHQADDAGAAGGGEDASVDDKIGKQLALGKNKQSANKVGDSKQQASTGNAVQAQKDGQGSASTSEGKISVAAAVGVNLQNATARAELPVDVTSAGALTLSASNNTDAKVVSDGSALPQADADGKTAGSTTQVGIGAAVSVNKVASVADAIVGGGAVVRSNGLSLSAGMTDVAGDSTHTVQTEAASGAGGSKVGIAGSLALNLVDTRSDAAVRSGANVDAGTGAVALAAENNTDITAKAVPVDKGASGGKVGIGASVAVNITGNQSTAEIADGATLAGSGAVSLDAKAAHKAATEAEAGSAGGVAITPALALAMLNNTTSARLGTGAALQNTGAVSVSATQRNVTTTAAKGSAVGESAAIGAAVGIALVNDVTSATTERDILDATGDVRFKATASSRHTTTATASSKGGKSDDEAGKTGADGKKVEDATVDDKVDNQLAYGKTQQTQAKVGSAKQQTATGNAAGGKASAASSEGKVSVAAAVAVNVIDANTTASVAANRTVSTTGAFELAASGQTDASAKSDGTAVGKTAQVGIGAAASVNQVKSATLAGIGNDATVRAKGIAVGATMTDVAGDRQHDIEAKAESGAGGSKVGIAASLALNLANTASQALVGERATLQAGGGDVSLTAEDRVKAVAQALPTTTGGASGGSVGVGVSVALNLIDAAAVARLGTNAGLTGARDLAVAATTAVDSDTQATSGAAGGKLAFDAAVAVTTLNQSTQALIQSGAGVAASGDVALQATSSGTHTATAKGEAKSGTAAIGAAAGVITSNSQTQAVLDRDLSAGGKLALTASATRAYTADATASAGGSQASKTYDDNKAQADSATSSKTLANNQNSQTNQGTQGGGKVAIAAAVGVNVLDDDVQAAVTGGRTLAAGGAMSVAANNDSNFSARGAGDAVDAKTQVGVAVGVGISIANNSTVASLADNTHVTKVGDLSVTAASTQNTSPAFARKLAAEGVAGAGASKVGVAGAFAVAVSNAQTLASIGANARIDQAGNIRLDATNTSLLGAKAWAAAKAGTVGVGASVATVVSNNQYKATLGDNAQVDAASLSLNAQNLKVSTPGVSLQVSGVDDIKNLPDRLTSGPLIGGTNYYTEAVSGAAGDNVSVAGAFAVNVFTDTTEAAIGNGAKVVTTGEVALTSLNDTGATSLAAAAALGGKVGVGVSSAVVSSHNDTSAHIGTGADVNGAGGIRLGATNLQDVNLIGFSGAAGGNVAVAGVANVLTTKNTAQAYIADSAATKVQTGGNLSLDAKNALSVFDIVSGVAVGGSVGVGVAAAVHTIENETRAFVGKGVQARVDGAARVAAAASEDLKTFAVGAAGAGSVAVGGSAIVNVLNAQTQAYLGDGVQLNKGATPGQQSVAVSASDDTTVFDVVAGAGGGGSVGGGAAGDVGVLSKTTQAWIGGNAWVEAGQNLTVKANSQEDLRLSSIGFGAGGSAGLAGSAAVFTLKTDTEARIGDGATLRARGNALVAADGRTAVDLIAGSAAAGGSAAVGAAAGVVVLDKTTLARIGENANVQALGYGTALQAATGHYDIAYGGAITGDGRVTKGGLAPTDAQGNGIGGRDAFKALTQQRSATARTEALQGLGVTATNSDSVKAYAVTGAGAGAAAITLGANVSTVDTDTRAQIGAGAKINQTADVADAAQSVRVAAGNEQFHLGLAGAASGAGAVAVGAGADVFVSKNTTQAAIASGAQVKAARDVQVLAEGQTQVLDMGVGLSAAGTVAVAGSVAVVSIANTTQALVGAGTTRIDASGNVRVAARDDTQTDMVAGAAAAGIGAAGVGAAVGVSSLTKTTQAGIGDGVTVNALGKGTGNDMTAFSGRDEDATIADARGVQVQATSSEDLFTVVASGAAGLYAGISGAISVESVRSDTQASIGNDAKINQANAGANAAQDVNVSARNQLRSQVVTGSLALGAGALAGAVDVGTVNNRTTASIGSNAKVTAARDIGVNALSRQDYTTTVVSGAGGLVGLAGGIAVYGIGEALSQDATDQLSHAGNPRNVNQEADAQASDDTVGRMLAASDDARTRDIAATAQSKRSAVSISSSLSAPQPSGNAAQVGDGAVLVAGRDVGVNAHGTLDFGMKTGAVSVGALGLGAGVGIANFQLANQALVGNNVTVSAGGDLRVTASLAEKAQALGFAGTGGVVALNAAYASLADDSVTRAAIGNNLTIHKADEVLVNATDTRSLDAEAYGASVGAYVAGASIARSVIDGSTSASIGSGAQIGAATGDAVRALTVEAASDVQAQSHAVAAAAGLGLALSGSVATAKATPEVSAFVSGGDIRLAEDARIAATGKTRAQAESLGVNLSFTAAAGAAVATAEAVSRVDAYLGSGTQLSGRNLTVSAAQQLAGSGPNVSANATGASGALFAGLTATSAHADTDSRVNSRVGDGSTLTLTGTAAVNALNNTRQQADASGFAGGIVAAGFNDARATSNTVTQATLGDNVQVAAPVANTTLMAQLALSADGTDTNRANAISGSGGLIAGSAATATTAGTSLTQATTGSGDGSHRIAAKKVSLDARHTTDYNATVNSVNASVVGASGAKAVNTVNSTVTAAIGDNGVVSANEIKLSASNSSRKDWIGSSNGDTAGFNVDSGSGGVIDLPAASSQTDISHITTAAIGAGAKVHALLPSAGTARLDMDAFNDIVARDKVRLDSGGLISVARSVSNVNVNRADATVSFGDGASVTSDNGDINAGAHATVALDARAQANVYGLAGAPSGRAYAVYNGNNQAIVDTNALLRADDGSVMLSGGQGYDGTRTRIDANAAVNLWNKTAIPITTDPDAQANVNSNARVSLATGSKVESAEDIALYADKGIVSVNAKGIGKDLYREALAAIASGISNLFGGGDVSFDVIGGSTRSTGSAVVHVDGIAMTGINRRASLTFEIELIDAAGNPVSAPVYAKVFQTNELGQFVDTAGNPTTDPAKYVEVGKQVLWRMKSTASKGVTYSVELGKGIGADIQERIMKLRSLMSQYASDEVARGAYQAEINFLMFKLVELGLASGATNPDGTIKLDPATGQPLINPGQWNNPSPRQIAETQIKQYQMQLMSETGKATGSGQLIQATTTAAIGSATQIGTSAGSIVTHTGTLATTNAGIDTQLKSLANFSVGNATYVATQALIGDNATQLAAIQQNRTLNTNALTTIAQKNTVIDGLLGEIGGLRTDMQALAYGSAAYMAKQAEIDTRQASILARAGEIKTLLTSVSTQSAAIDAASTKIASNNATISANQAALATAFKKSDGSQDGVVTAINTARSNADAARNGIASAAVTIDTEAGKFANATTGYVQVVNQTATALDTSIGQKTSAATNLVQLNSTLGQQSTTPANGPIADFITVNDITVKLGNIRTSGDVLEGTGQLNAPGDAQIDIVNNTPNFLKLKNLTVNSDDGGTVRFNGVLVNSGADINAINSTGTGASALQVLTRDTSAAPKPAINITSTYDANAAGATVLAPAPNIELAGDISNLRGSVTVKSAAGSILSNGSIRAGTVDIKADNGDFVQSYVDNFFHVGGDPASIKDNGTPLGGGIVANGSVFLSARYLNINSLVQSGIQDWKIDLPAAPKLTGTASFFGLSQTSLDNAVTAYNNATGAAKDALRYTTYTVAAGVVTYDALLKRLEVGMDFAKADRNTADWATRTAVSGGLYQLVSDYGNIGASYDVVNNRFELDGTQVSGGYIQVYGQIMNTSTNGAGTLRALDGYGQILVNNPTGLSVVINRLDTGKDSTGTGRGIAGIIDITDIQGIGNGSQLTKTHTVYKRENGVVTRNDVVDTLATSGRATTYAPQTGLRYAWTTGTDNSTISYWHYKGAQFFGSSSLRTGPTGEVVSQSGPFILDSYRLDNGTYLYTDTGKTGTPYTQNSQTHKTGDSLWVKTDEWSTCNWWTLCIAGNYHQKFTETTPTTTITTKTLTADNKINIEFSGYDQGKVTVNSAADVLLKGEIRNSSGTTTVNAGSGVTPVAGVSTADRSIVQLNDTALVTGKDIVLNATGTVGGTLNADPARAIAVAVNGGKLDAAAAQGNVNVEQTVGTLNVGRVTAGGSALDGKGRVTLRSDGSIVAANAATSLIQGDRVDLTSQNGAIGGIAAPLKVNVGYSDDISKRGLFGLRASAQGDIGIETQAWSGNTAGHLLVDTVVSTGGDVLLKAPGRIIDNNPIESVDTRTWNELLAFWDASGLRAGTDENKANQAQAMKSYEQGLTQEYKLYWQIRSTQPDASAYDPAFKYQASAAERQGLTVAGQTPQQSAAAIAAFETERTASYHALNEKVGGFSASYDSGFRYQASTAERDAILAKSSWTDRELGISISAGLLKDVTNTNPVVKSANVSGRNVTLQAGIAIGETKGAVVVPTNIDPRNLTDEMKVALASAERSDIVVTDSAITVLRRAPVNFSALDAFNASVTAAPVAGTDIGSAFLASMGSARLGSIDVTGETRIKVRGSITNALPTSGPLQTGNLVLEAAYGGIGYVPGDGVNAGQSQPLRLKLRDGATLTARASENIEIEEEGDLNVDTVFSRQTAKLTAEGSILDAIGDTGLNVLANNIDLTARNGNIGAAGAGALDVGVTGTTGRITAQAAQDIHLNGPRGRYLNFGDVTAGGSASLSGDADLRLYGAVQAAGAVDLSAGLTLAMAATSSVRSTASNLKLSAGELTMADGATLRGDVGTVRIDTLTDATITGISTGNGTADAVRIKAGGDVRDGGDTRLDIVADAAPAAGVTIEAGGDIGKGNALEMRLRHLDAKAGGSADFAVSGDVVVGQLTSVDNATLTATGQITTTAVESTLGGVTLVSTGGNIDAGRTVAFGDVRLQSDVGQITAGRTQAGGQVALVATAGSVQATDTTAGGRIDVTAAQDIALGTASAGGDIVLAAGRALTAGTLASTAGDIRARAATGDLRTGRTTSTAGNVTLVADAGDVAAGRTQAGGNVALIAGAGSVQADATTAGGRIEATAARDIALTTAAAGGDIALAAGRNLAATTLSSLAGDIRASAATGDLRTGSTTASVGDVTLTANAGDVVAGTTQAGGDVDMSATAGSVQADATTAGGRIGIAAAQDIGVNRATAGGDIVLAAGRDLQATTLASTGGGIQATTGRDLTIGTASAQRDIVLDAGRHLTAGTLASTQGSVIAKARTGNLRIGTLDAALDGVLSAPQGEVAVERVKAGRDFTLEARHDVDVREGSAGGTFTLSSTGGNATAGTLTADAVVMRASGRVAADRLHVVSLFDLAGDRVNANIYGGAKPVKGTVTGFNGGTASDVVLALSGQGGFAIDRFKARTAAITNPVGPLAIDSMLVVDRATVTNPQTHVVIDQHDRSIQPGADVQIFSFGAPFSFSLYDNHAFTDAFVIYRSPEHDQIADMGLNRSAVEFSELALSVARKREDPTLEARQGTEGQDLRPVRYSGVPVKLDGDCSKNIVPECTR
ncbi:leukotoxin LktA family filamentous adhesin [Variovorax sp. UMC13]|uniref:leukotoxin LktA family filamentous adhesin n=1 Tax=Variovorax sp. UMC13 TaxID=1862326 RepID=UPI0016025DC8|nr:leukotoxin LktA family filamentous adhesin [Variovorax sp. UMC13]